MSAATAESITRPRRLLTRFGPFIVVLALAVATTSFLIFSGYTPLAPADNVVLGLFIANISTILLLFALVVVVIFERGRLVDVLRGKSEKPPA